MSNRGIYGSIKYLLILLLCGCLLLSGCSNDLGILQTLEKSGVLRVLFVEKGNSLLEKDEATGNYTGLEAELAQAIADEFGLELEVVSDETGRGPEAVLDAGEADLVLGSIPDTQSLRNDYSVSLYYAQGYLFVATQKGDYRNTLAALEGGEVGSAEELSDYMLLYTGEQLDGQQPTYTDAASAAQAILEGEIQAYFCYEDEAFALTKTEGIQVQDAIGTPVEQYVAILPSKYAELLDRVNVAIEKYLDREERGE